jgi:hypothetical protein
LKKYGAQLVVYISLRTSHEVYNNYSIKRKKKHVTAVQPQLQNMFKQNRQLAGCGNERLANDCD